MLENEWFTIDRKAVKDIRAEVETLVKDADAMGEERVLHIGTDAQKIDRRVDYVTCIVIVRPGKGGRVFYTRTRKPKSEVHSLRQKLFDEAWMSIETAMEINPTVPKGWKIVVHLDVNPDVKWESSKYIQELSGMVMAQGFECLTKPDAWCASHAADHVVKHKNIPVSARVRRNPARRHKKFNRGGKNGN